nr:MAG TPA: hypothetical protein [Crassvirales sp.]
MLSCIRMLFEQKYLFQSYQILLSMPFQVQA